MRSHRSAAAPLSLALGRIEARMPAHYCQGKLPVAFVFSVPGAIEAQKDKPVAGETGANLDSALEILHSRLPDTFSSTDRYDYRITNAYEQPIAKSLGHCVSEASKDMVREADNIKRVIKDLDGCHTAILCGKKAQLLAAEVAKEIRTVVCVPHIGNTGLNTSYPLPSASAAKTSDCRRVQRVQCWARAVLLALGGCDAA